jgi:hypothetical protein
MVKMHTMIKFLNEKKCVKIFLKYRWPDDPHCPFCGSKNIIRYGSYEKYWDQFLLGHSIHSRIIRNIF